MNHLELQSKIGNYEFMMNDCLVFTGSNHIIKNTIFKLIDRNFTSSTYSIVEEDILGEKGIKLIINDKVMTSRKIKYISIESINDIVEQFIIGKKNLLDQIMIELLNDFEFAAIFEEMQDLILRIESKINHSIREILPNIELECETFSGELLYKKFSKLIWFENEKEQLAYFLNPRIAIDNFCCLLEKYIEQTEDYIFLQIKYPDVFLSEGDIEYFSRRLIDINKKFKKIYLIIYHFQKCIDYGIENFTSLTLCFESMQQLPEFEYYRNSIERFYPIELNISDGELYTRTLKVLPYVGSRVDFKSLISSRDVVILKLLNSLLDLDQIVETSQGEITNFEQLYLLS